MERRGRRGFLALLLLLGLSLAAAAGEPAASTGSSGSSKKPPESLQSRARRRAVLFARAEKPDDDEEAHELLVGGLKPEERGAVYYEVGRVFTEGHADEQGVLLVERDLPRGLRYLTRSAREHGYPHAQQRLAVAHATGLLGPVPPAPGDAVDAASKAPAGKEGRLLGSGGEEAEAEEELVLGDELRSLVLLQFAATGGDVAAAMALGYRYLYGHGVPASCERAAMLYEVAANAAVDEMERHKVLPPNERTRLSEGAGGLTAAARRRAIEGDQQLVEYYKHTAEKGDVGAMVQLGKLHYHGSQGVPQNLREAAHYFEQAARLGDPTALGSVGHMYLLGVGVAQSNETARHYFQKGAEKGDPASLNGMGHLYLHGMGVERDVERAVQYLQKASHEKGHAESHYNLGLVYSGIVLTAAEEGGAVGKKAAGAEAKEPKLQDLSESVKTLRDNNPALQHLPNEVLELLADATAQAAGLERQRQLFEERPEFRDAVLKEVEKMEQEFRRYDREHEVLNERRRQTLEEQERLGPQLAEHRAQLEERIRKTAIEHGVDPKDVKVLFKESLGSQLASVATTSSPANDEEGGAVKKNLQKALKYFSLAAQSGHMGALHKVGQMYAQGIAAARSCTTAVHAFKGVAERGPWVANLSKAYDKHKRGDLLGALLLYAHMAEMGYEVAQANAAVLLEDEQTCGQLGLVACQRLAVRYHRHASKQGNAEASLKVGDAYYYGRAGLGADFERAAKYYQTAAELRQPQAMFNLGLMHQHGVGLKQDFHLAKRYFDSSAQTQPDARWPVNLALAGLYFHWWYTGEAGGITDKPILRTGPPKMLLEVGLLAEARKARAALVWERLARAWERLARVWERLVPPLEEEGEDNRYLDLPPRPSWDWERAVENAPALDTVLVGVLTAALLYVLWVRAEQREAARRRRREEAAAEAAVEQAGRGRQDR